MRLGNLSRSLNLSLTLRFGVGGAGEGSDFFGKEKENENDSLRAQRRHWVDAGGAADGEHAGREAGGGQHQSEG